MARHKNVDWGLNNPIKTTEECLVALLMDIRDELQQLNGVFACHNFQGIPQTMKRVAVAVEKIDRRVSKRIKLQKEKRK